VFDSPTRGGSSRSAFTPSLLRYPPPLIERANDGGVRRNDLSVSHELRLPGDAEESEDEVEGKREGGEGGAEAAKRTPNRKEKEANRMEDEEEKAVEDVEEGEEGATAYRLKSLRADKKEAFDARARMRTRTRDEANARTSIEFIRDGTSPCVPGFQPLPFSREAHEYGLHSSFARLDISLSPTLLRTVRVRDGTYSTQPSFGLTSPKPFPSSDGELIPSLRSRSCDVCERTLLAV
jgi:hypothetical protein